MTEQRSWRVLWIEDGVTNNMSRLYAAAIASGRYDLTPTMNATDGAAYLVSQHFDAVIVDVRLPPGNGDEWIRVFSERGRTTAAARLGLLLVYAALRPSALTVALSPLKPFNATAKFGFLTVEPESDLRSDLSVLPECSYARKQPNDPMVLVRLIEKLLK